jgi:type VI secretion system protein ImpH
MAATSWKEDLSLEIAQRSQFSEIERLLREHPGRFDFFQAVRVLLRLSAGRKPVGRFVNPDHEAVRFAVEPSIAFPPSNIERIQWDGVKPRVLVTFMGLTGPAGVLPRCYSAFLLSRIRERDRTLVEFFDLFNHRLISLFYRAWEKYRFGVSYERDGIDKVSKYLISMVGLGTAGLENRLGISDEHLLSYTGLLALQARSAAALEQLLEDYFDVPVEVEQFIGVWRKLDSGDQCVFDETDSYSEQLGVAAVVGDAIWDRQSRVRLKLGPLDEERYLSFLPSGSAWKPLGELTHFFCGPDLEVEVQLVLKQSEVPRFNMGKDDASGPRLGWFTWIRSGPDFDRSPGDTVLLLRRPQHARHAN